MPQPVPQEALDYIKNKKLKVGFSYEDVWREEHARSFTVAKCMEMDLLKDIQDSLSSAIEDGIPYEQWAKDIQKVMEDYGWWGRQEMVDPKTGKKKEVQLGSPRRLRTIFNVNMRSAYNVGAYRQTMDSDAHPYLMYRIGSSKKHRKEHVAWDGLVLKKDDSWWDTHMPPNGWGCKCYVRAVTEARFKRLKDKGIVDESYRDYGQRLAYKPVKTKAPADIPVEYVNKRTGKVYQGVKGIDPGFEYNPASESRNTTQSDSFAEKNKKLTDALNGPTKPTAKSLETPVADAFESIPARWSGVAKTVFDAINTVHGDGALHKIPIKTTSATTYYGQFSCYPNQPIKISLSTSAEGVHPELTLAHEIGHFLDNDAFPKEAGEYHASDGSPNAKVAALMKALSDSDAIKWFIDSKDAQDREYYLRPTEMVARSYAQYVAVKSGNTTMLNQVSAIIGSELNVYQHTQWTEADFRPIMKAYDDLFEEIGWLEKNEN